MLLKRERHFFVLSLDGKLESSTLAQEEWARFFQDTSLPGQLLSMVLQAPTPSMLDSLWGVVEVFSLNDARGRKLLLCLEPHAQNKMAERLSPMQRLVAGHAINGATVVEIARELQKKPETIRTHLRIIYRKLEVSNRVELSKVIR